MYTIINENKGLIIYHQFRAYNKRHTKKRPNYKGERRRRRISYEVPVLSLLKLVNFYHYNDGGGREPMSHCRFSQIAWLLRDLVELLNKGWCG